MKLGIFGAGKIVQEVLPVLASLPYEKIRLLGTRRSEDRAIDLCRSYSLDGYCLDPDELLEQDIDAVYVALPNHLHFAYAKKALLAGKHVLLEKPAVFYVKEWEELTHLAFEKKRILIEGMSLHFAPAYQALQNARKEIGAIKLADFQFCQYSSRYDSFCRGIIAPAFDPEQGGGALMDLNIYNIHAILGLFGSPEETVYFPNMDRGVDTSGVLHLRYPGFQVTALAAKDCQGTNRSTIQGTDGCLCIPMPMNQIAGFDVYDRSGRLIRREEFSRQAHRLSYEFLEFERIVRERDTKRMAYLNEISADAIRILEKNKTY